MIIWYCTEKGDFSTFQQNCPNNLNNLSSTLQSILFSTFKDLKDSFKSAYILLSEDKLLILGQLIASNMIYNFICFNPEQINRICYKISHLTENFDFDSLSDNDEDIFKNALVNLSQYIKLKPVEFLSDYNTVQDAYEHFGDDAEF